MLQIVLFNIIYLDKKTKIRLKIIYSQSYKIINNNNNNNNINNKIKQYKIT